MHPLFQAMQEFDPVVSAKLKELAVKYQVDARQIFALYVISTLQTDYKLPNDLWDGLKYYSDQIGEKKSYRIFFSSLLTFVVNRVRILLTRKSIDALINAEFMTRVIRASGHVVLPGTKAGKVTPELLEEAVREIEGVGVSMTKDYL